MENIVNIVVQNTYILVIYEIGYCERDVHFYSDKSSVKFAPTAFVDAYEYLDTEETKNTVNRYELYMVGKGRPVGFKVSIYIFNSALEITLLFLVSLHFSPPLQNTGSGKGVVIC